jgi:hypothetical protein
MKKGKFLVLGLIALLLAGGLALASCGEKCSNGGNCVSDSTHSSSCNAAGCNVKTGVMVPAGCNCQ